MPLTAQQKNKITAILAAAGYFDKNPRITAVNVKTPQGQVPVYKDRDLDLFRNMIDQQSFIASAQRFSRGFSDKELKDNRQLIRYLARNQSKDAYLINLSRYEGIQLKNPLPEEVVNQKPEAIEEEEKKKESQHQEGNRSYGSSRSETKPAEEKESESSETSDEQETKTKPAEPDQSSNQNNPPRVSLERPPKPITETPAPPRVSLERPPSTPRVGIPVNNPAQATHINIPASNQIRNYFQSWQQRFFRSPILQDSLSFAKVQVQRFSSRAISLGGDFLSGAAKVGKSFFGIGAKTAGRAALMAGANAAGVEATAATAGLAAPVEAAILAATVASMAYDFAKKNSKKILMISLAIGILIFIGIPHYLSSLESGALCPPYQKTCASNVDYPGSPAGSSTGLTTAPKIGGPNSCPTDAQISANRQSPETCQYLKPNIDLFQTTISQDSIDSYIEQNQPTFVNKGTGDATEFQKRVRYIIENAQQSGLNPVLFLGYWRTESLFSTVGKRDMGCAGDNFYEQVDCAMAIKEFSDPRNNPIANCARSKDANSVACLALKSVRNKPFLDGENPIQYPIATFDDFAEAYGPRSTQLNNGGVNNNCVSTYNQLLQVANSVNACTAATVASCPIGPAIISCGSAANPSNNCGHGGVNYPSCDPALYSSCPYTNELKKAIDVVPKAGAASGTPVYLPTINGESLTWINSNTLKLAGNWGYRTTFSATSSSGQKIVLDLEHINLSSSIGTAKTGDQVATIWDQGSNSHLHIGLLIDSQATELKDVGMCYQ